MTPYDPADFLKQLAPNILAELTPPTELKRFTTNPALVGAYVEAGVRQFVRRYLAPIRVCTGAVIDQKQTPGSISIPQIDTIAWVPQPVSAVFEIGEFAVIPRSSSLGILEVKSSAYDVNKLEEQTDPERIKSLTAEPVETETTKGSIFGMGIVSVLQKNQSNGTLEDLRVANRVVVLFHEHDEGYEPQVEDIYRLVNFLAALRMRAAERALSPVGVRMALISKSGKGS